MFHIPAVEIIGIGFGCIRTGKCIVEVNINIRVNTDLPEIIVGLGGIAFPVTTFRVCCRFLRNGDKDGRAGLEQVIGKIAVIIIQEA